MNNTKIAITYANNTTKNGDLLMSDQFFAPFSEQQRKIVRRKLIKMGMLVYPMGDCPNGALVVRKDSKYIVSIVERDGMVAGAWMKNEPNVVMFGSEMFEDTIGVSK